MSITFSDNPLKWKHPVQIRSLDLNYDPDRAQKLIISRPCPDVSTRNISSIHAFLSNVADRLSNAGNANRIYLLVCRR